MLSAVTLSYTARTIVDVFTDWSEVERPLDQWGQRHRHRMRNQRPPFTQEFLLRAMQHPREHYRLRAAELGQRSAAVMGAALQDRCFRVRRLGAGSPVAPRAALNRAVADTSVEVRRAVAANANTPIAALVLLLDDRDPEVVHTAARQPRLPLPVLWRLARSPDDTLRAIVAGHRVPGQLLMQLATDPSPEVTLAVAANPWTPDAALRWLAQVSRGAEHRRLLACHPSTPVEVLDELADSHDVNGWILLASNPYTTNATLERIPTGSHSPLRRLIAEHPQASPALRQRLSLTSQTPLLDSIRPELTTLGNERLRYPARSACDQ